MSSRPTIADVAKRASVGKVTVSYVMNGRAKEFGISDDTAERIMVAARELNYRPNALARSLSRRRADAIAVVFQEPNYFAQGSMFLNEALRGVCAECVEQDVDLMLHTKPLRPVEDEAGTLTDGRIDGVLLLRDEDDPTLRSLIESRFPLVLFFTRATDPGIAYVDCDNFTGGKIAAQHLVSHGHRNLGMVIGSSHSVASMDRHQGFRAGLEAAGIALPSESIIQFETPLASRKDFIDMLNRPNRPTGLFVWSDDVAFECMKIITEFGLRIPEDISIVGFDSTTACDMVTPKLTSICQPVEEMARAATKILVAKTKKQDVSPTQLIFSPTLQIRKSTGPPAP